MSLPFYFYIILSILFLLCLFVLSKKISTFIYLLAYLATRSKTAALFAVTIVLLPGTIIHELSHFFVALILFVPTGELSIFPTIEKDGTIRAGKLMIAKVDPFRHAIVGLAPILMGLSFIYFLGKIFFVNLSWITTNQYSFVLLPILCYLLFVTSMTMFSSKKDVESLIIAGPIIIILFLFLSQTGLRVVFPNTFLLVTDEVFQFFALSLFLMTGFNSLVYLSLLFLLSLGKKRVKRGVSST